MQPARMRVVSLNRGLVREVAFGDRCVRTAIFKDPVSGSVHLSDAGLDGDEQADPSVHGGSYKAVYAYSADAYRAEWSAEIERTGLAFGAFGENLTVSGLDESLIHIGDLFNVGTCALRVTQPRIPCFKLGIRFGDATMLALFLEGRRCGVYFAVERAGELRAGDILDRVEVGEGQIPVVEIYEIYKNRGTELERAHQILESRHLIPSWRVKLENFLSKSAT